LGQFYKASSIDSVNLLIVLWHAGYIKLKQIIFCKILGFDNLPGALFHNVAMANQALKRQKGEVRMSLHHRLNLVLILIGEG